MNLRHLSRKTGSLSAKARVVVLAGILQVACISGCSMWSSSGESGLSRMFPGMNSDGFPSQSEPPLEADNVRTGRPPVDGDGQE